MQLIAYCAVFIILLNVIVLRVVCYSFNVENVMVISEDSVKNTYFSYSLLLQAGKGVSSLIIGAPKNINRPSIGGDIYKCDIDTNNGSTCVQYPIEAVNLAAMQNSPLDQAQLHMQMYRSLLNSGRFIDSSTPNGNFFGMSMDGDSRVHGGLVACAPRTLPANRQLNYFRGYCVYVRNTSHITEPPLEIIPLNNAGTDSSCCDAGGKAYYNLGFAMAGFDVSYYSEVQILNVDFTASYLKNFLFLSQRDILLGAPGIKKFNGAAISYSLEDPRIVSLLPYRTAPSLRDEDTYFGYSVTTAKFMQNSEEVWFIAGAPRANNLKGKVTVYFYDVRAREKMNIVISFEGDEVGSYFGSSLLAEDVNNDRIIDILIGAPMASGKTWDEGSVYFYRGISERSFLGSVKLTGSSKIGSRFGTAIVSLGDFDLDGFNDVAISAPYEDDGRGAVYIYKGSLEGLTDSFSQRLSPVDFSLGGIAVKGFGMGISKGNDVDGNGHNDIAIGAYKTDQVFIVKSYSIIDYRILLNPDINSIANDTANFNIQFCIIYTKRSEKNILRHADFGVTLEMDYRSHGGDIYDNITSNLGQLTCKKYAVKLKQSVMDISPFQITFQLKILTENIIAHGDKILSIQIPYSHGCGDDNICDTALSIEMKSEKNRIILGLDKQIDLNIVVSNNGEPAYQCGVKLAVPGGIQLRNTKDCIMNDGNYTCLFNEMLIGDDEKDFIFDVKDITPDISSIEIRAEVTSLGINNPESNYTSIIELPIVLQNTPYIVGKSTPENMELEMKSSVKDFELVHQFSVGKNGPSPLRLDVDILIPVLEQDGESIFHIVEVEGKVDNIQIACTASVTEEETVIDEIGDLNGLLNRTVLVTCESEETCMKFSCQGDYLYNSAQLAVFKVRMSIKSQLLVSKYKGKLGNKDLIAFIPVAYQSSSTGRVGAPGLFLIFVSGNTYVPLWVYLLAPSIGVILLILISYGLYRCHFFDRIYKDKLEQEKILVSNVSSSVEDEIFDDVVFRPMEENIQNKEKEYM